uniref:Zinc finger protein 568 n=1 Tax=Homo sapiens TaxID=9606 RepID=A0A1Y8EHF7_HUMAN
MKPAQRN